MKPLNLIIEGLYSYQSRQEIDFTKLTEAHLFGIFGAVGSGKSSVLEAISFSLYGETDKLNKKDNRSYNMMNLRSNSMYIDFDFMIEEIEYKTLVKSKRNSKNYEDVKKQERSFYKKVDNEFLPIEEKEIHDAIGLSYENFKRTIIIPQGQFKEFLELGDADRTKMLKELFNLGKYDLYDKLRPLIFGNLTDINVLKGQLEQLGDVNVAQMEDLDKSLILLKKEIEDLTKLLEEKNKEAELFRKIKDLKEKEAEAEKRFSLLKTKEEEFKLLDKNIKAYEFCFMNFKQEIAEADRLKKEIMTFSESLEANKKSFEENNNKLTEQKKAFLTIKKSYDSREDLKKQIEEIKKIEQIITFKEEIIEINKSLALLDKDLKDKTILSKEIKVAHEKLSLDLQKEKALLPDIKTLNELKDWYNQEFVINKEIKRLDESFVALNKEILAFKKEALVFYMAENSETTSLEVYKLLEKKKNALKESIKPIEDELDALAIQKKLEDYAALLEDGKACPLCGSESHPSIMDSKQVGDLLEKYRKQKSLVETNIKKIEENMLGLQRLNSRLELKDEQLKASLSESKLKKNELSEHAKLFIWDKYKTAEELKKALELFTEKQKSIDVLDKALIDSNKRREHLENEFKLIEKSFTETENKAKERDSVSKTLKSQLSALKLEDYESKSKQEILDFCAQWEKSFLKIEHDYNKLSTEIETLEAKQNELKGLIAAIDTQLKKDKALEISLSEKLDKLLVTSDYKSIEEVKNVLSQNISLVAERTKLEDYNKSLSTVNAELSSLKKDLKDKVYDENKHKDLSLLIADLSAKKDLLNTQMGKIQGSIDKLKKDLERLKDYKKREKELSLRAEDLESLRKLFTGSGFVNYVSSVHLNNLCLAANDRFHKLTGQKLSLEMTENNNFQVRDYMNGGNLRSVKTLSGGQSFQASLALALALTDSIQKFSKSKQNFFFLDEGFGSLDKDALSVVFEALKSLKRENRVVGVISHVEELQQEMGVFVKVVNDVERGSELSFSWD